MATVVWSLCQIAHAAGSLPSRSSSNASSSEIPPLLLPEIQSSSATKHTYDCVWLDSFNSLESDKSMPQRDPDGTSGNSILSLDVVFTALEDGGPSLQPSVDDIACILRRCRVEADNVSAQHLHAYMCQWGLESHPSLGKDLVTFLVEVGSMRLARQLFDRLTIRVQSSWNALITGYLKCGDSIRALMTYQRMQEEDPSLYLSKFDYINLLKACAKLKDLESGQILHAHIARKDAMEKDVMIGSTLVHMYAKCGLLTKAQEVFDKLPVKNAVTWNALIGGYAQHQHGEEALKCFEQMQIKGISPDAITFISILKACGCIGAADKGREIHAQIAKRGWMERDPIVGTALVDMYAKCGFLAKAHGLFDKLSVRDTVSWNALITGYAQHGHGEEALECFEGMRREGVSPTAVTYASSLKACGSTGDIGKGQEIHTEVMQNGVLKRDIVVGNALIDMYAKCGLLAKAQEVFDNLADRNVVTFNALIAGFTQHNRPEEALQCFEQMLLNRMSPDVVTFVCSLNACGSIGATEKGQEIHAEVCRKGLERSLLVGSALVNMYVKCGALEKAQEVFDKLSARDVVSWTSLIAGYGQIGETEYVFHVFERMVNEGVKPDLATFNTVLNACNHAGAVDEGQRYFEAMSKEFGISPSVDHCTCMIDLFGRAGQLNKAIVMINEMPNYADIILWHTLLAACQKWGDVDTGREAFAKAMHLDGKDSAIYICMSNIYSDAGMEEDANEIEALRVENQACTNKA